MELPLPPRMELPLPPQMELPLPPRMELPLPLRIELPMPPHSLFCSDIEPAVSLANDAGISTQSLSVSPRSPYDGFEPLPPFLPLPTHEFEATPPIRAINFPRGYEQGSQLQARNPMPIDGMGPRQEGSDYIHYDLTQDDGFVSELPVSRPTRRHSTPVANPGSRLHIKPAPVSWSNCSEEHALVVYDEDEAEEQSQFWTESHFGVYETKGEHKLESSHKAANGSQNPQPDFVEEDYYPNPNYAFPPQNASPCKWSKINESSPPSFNWSTSSPQTLNKMANGSPPSFNWDWNLHHSFDNRSEIDW